MGIYNRKFAESAIDDTIQTPDDVGVDLDQVEKDIAGEDGIEAHRDEVEAAEEGLIGDPVEEAAFIMYESEYNYNQIMQAIGIAELHEASAGREMIYEAADIKGFFAKVKKLLVTMFEGITKAVKNVLAKMDFQVKNDKKYIEKNKAAIISGASAKWSAKGFKFPEKITFDTSKIKDGGKRWSDKCEKALADLRDGKDAKTYLDETSGDNYRSSVIRDVSGVDADDITNMTKALIEKLYGQRYENLNGHINVNADVINVLANDRETTAIRAAYNDIKKSYQTSIKTISKWEKSIKASDYTNNVTMAMTACEAGARVIKYEKNVVNAAYSVFMKAARAKRAQARSLAHAFVRASGKKEAEVQHNSASLSNSTFNGISFI